MWGGKDSKSYKDLTCLQAVFELSVAKTCTNQNIFLIIEGKLSCMVALQYYKT